MFKNSLLFFLLLTVSSGYTQNLLSRPALPPIDITLTNGERFTSHNLQYGPLVLIYFSPDCGHCKEFITSLLQQEKLIRGKQVLLVTFVDLNTLRAFEETIGLAKFPNIRTGTEGESYRLAKSLTIRKFPYVAVYDSSRRLLRSFEGEQPFSHISEAIGNL